MATTIADIQRERESESCPVDCVSPENPNRAQLWSNQHGGRGLSALSQKGYAKTGKMAFDLIAWESLGHTNPSLR